MAKVTFDGTNKLIVVDAGITALDVRVDLYSDWKEWAVLSTNLKYLPAFRTIGGDPVGSKNFGRAFFLSNGWKIRPQEANHELVVTGNLFLDAGESGGLFVPTLGGYTVSTIVERSLDVFGVDDVGGGVWTHAKGKNVADATGLIPVLLSR